MSLDPHIDNNIKGSDIDLPSSNADMQASNALLAQALESLHPM